MAAPPSSPAPTPIADDLLDRYVHAVGQYLWPAAAADVQEELAANLTAAMEEREGVLGRALEPAEVAAILKRHGHPLEVAGRYMRRPYLIGPAWLPVYWSVLKMLLGITWLVYVVVNAVALSAVQPWTLAGVMGVLARSGGLLVQVFAWVTLVFAALEWGGERFRRLKPDTQAWDPMKLPKVHPQRRAKRSGRALCELLPGVFFLTPPFPTIPSWSSDPRRRFCAMRQEWSACSGRCWRWRWRVWGWTSRPWATARRRGSAGPKGRRPRRWRQAFSFYC